MTVRRQSCIHSGYVLYLTGVTDSSMKNATKRSLTHSVMHRIASGLCRSCTRRLLLVCRMGLTPRLFDRQKLPLQKYGPIIYVRRKASSIAWLGDALIGGRAANGELMDNSFACVALCQCTVVQSLVGPLLTTHAHEYFRRES